MEAILVAPKDEKEQNLLDNFLKSNGMSGLVISKKMKRYLAGLGMVKVSEKHPKFDISENDIINMLKETEEEVYGKYRKESSD